MAIYVKMMNAVINNIRIQKNNKSILHKIKIKLKVIGIMVTMMIQSIFNLQQWFMLYYSS